MPEEKEASQESIQVPQKLVGYILQQALQREDTGQHLQQLHRQKFIILQHPSSQAISEKLVFLYLQGELQVK
ncbi:unnamed protein product [Lynx pardinus]|uniref:Unnamed protein product n=1 Tax=Lynx pardinus TaxID=191816 RepID=A0A485MC48_LYNPA|nr:unnamed protein product [Lynx pardinus]